MSRELHLLTIWQATLGDRAVTSRELYFAAGDHEELELALCAACNTADLSPSKIGRMLSDAYTGDGSHSAIDRYGNANKVTRHPTLALVHAGRESRSKSFRWRCVTHESLKPVPPAVPPGQGCAILGPRRDDANDDAQRGWLHGATVRGVRQHVQDALAPDCVPIIYDDEHGLQHIFCAGISPDDDRLQPFKVYWLRLAHEREVSRQPARDRDLSLIHPGDYSGCASERAALQAALNPPTKPRGYMAPIKLFPNGW